MSTTAALLGASIAINAATLSRGCSAPDDPLAVLWLKVSILAILLGPLVGALVAKRDHWGTRDRVDGAFIGFFWGSGFFVVSGLLLILLKL